MLYKVWLYLVLCCAAVTAGSTSDTTGKMLIIATSILLASEPKTFGLPDPTQKLTIDYDRTGPIKRVRKCVQDIFKELGKSCQRRAHRMNEDSFWKVHRSLQPHMKGGRLRKNNDSHKKNEKNGAVNGIASSPIRLSAALRYFAGGDPLDIQLVHGISNTDVHNSIWHVVDAINQCPELEIRYPSDHSEQLKIARGFHVASQADFRFCAGALDGSLVWLHMPRLVECMLAECGQLKFFCGRKHKYGLNLQAVCDANGLFLDIDMSHPGSTSEYLAFETSDLKRKLETPGFLAPNLCLFGEAAHSNRFYMATPFKNVRSGGEDDFNVPAFAEEDWCSDFVFGSVAQLLCQGTTWK